MVIPGLHIDPADERPVYRQIVEGIRTAFRDGRLRAGGKLPPTRDLARDLGVNRNTVVAAYENLIADGLAEGHPGRGTFLVATLTGEAAAADARFAEDWPTTFSRAVEGPGVSGLVSVYRTASFSEGISFAGSYPAAELMPVDAFRQAITEAIRERGHEVLSYGPTGGHPPLRRTIAERMRARGSAVGPEAILVTNGSQQAVDLVFRALLDPGDPVIVETPTYTGALSVLGAVGARIIGVPADEEGMRPDLLDAAAERHRSRVIYVQPTFQNPTTRVMGEARRREILAIARRRGCAVVEDDWAADLRFEGRDEPTLHALDGGRRVLYLSTFSKKLLPGLRLGWVAAPPPVLERLLILKQIEDHGSSPLVQAALHAFLEAGGLEDHLSRTLPVYRARRDRMLSAMAREFPVGVRWSRPLGGLFVWAELPGSASGNDLLLAARERGVVFSPGELFHADGAGRPSMRLTYASVAPERIDAGIEILGSLLRERQDGIAGPGVRPEEAVPIL